MTTPPDSTDLPSLRAPTIASNRQAAALACDHERNRVLKLLVHAGDAVPALILAAIADGTPAAIFASGQRVRAAKAASPAAAAPAAAPAPAAPAAPSGARPWTEITARMNAANAQRRAPAEAPEAAE